MKMRVLSTITLYDDPAMQYKAEFVNCTITKIQEYIQRELGVNLKESLLQEAIQNC